MNCDVSSCPGAVQVGYLDVTTGMMREVLCRSSADVSSAIRSLITHGGHSSYAFIRWVRLLTGTWVLCLTSGTNRALHLVPNLCHSKIVRFSCIWLWLETKCSEWLQYFCFTFQVHVDWLSRCPHLVFTNYYRCVFARACVWRVNVIGFHLGFVVWK